MKTLHILKSEPDENTRTLMAILGQGKETTVVALYGGAAGGAVDYDRLLDQIFEHDRVISWW